MRTLATAFTLALVAVTVPVQAVQLHTLNTPLNVDFWVGQNGVFENGGGDDVTFDPALASHPANAAPGPLNATGSTLSFWATDPTTLGLSANGLWMAFAETTLTFAAPQLAYGSNSVSAFDGFNITANFFDPYVDGNDIDSPAPGSTVPLALNFSNPDSELAPVLSHSRTFNPDNTFSGLIYTQDVGGGPFIFKVSSSGTFLVNGQDPFAVFADPLIAGFYANLVPFMDAQHPGWTIVGSEFGLLETLDAADPNNSFNQFFGSSQAFYSLDPGAIPTPLPAALPLLLAALAGLLGLSGRRWRSA